MAKQISDKDKALGIIQSKWNEARKASVLDFKRFARYYKLFRGQQTHKNYQGLANLFVPEPYRIIRKKTAKLANAIKSIKATPQTQNDVENAKNSTQTLNFLRRKLNLFLTERTAIQESRIVGLSWIKATWRTDKETNAAPYKGFDFEFVPADKILLNPDATILDVFEGKTRWLIHEYESDFNTISKNPNYKKEDLALLKARGSSRTEKSSLTQSRFMEQTKPQRSDGKHRILEFWGMYGEEGEEENMLIVVADNALVLRFDKNPYEEISSITIPFVPFVANPVGQEMYPIGDLEPGESLFNELNDTRNQRMDTVTMNIDPPKEILKAANIDKKQLIARRGWFWESNIPNGVRFIPPAMQGVQAAIQEETVIRGDIQQYSGVIDFSPGTNVQAGVEIDTARGAIIAKGEADALTQDDLEILKISLRMLYRLVLAFGQSFLDRGFEMRLLDKGQESFVQVTKESIAGNFDLDIEMETLQDKTTTQQLALLLFNQAKTVPGANLGKFFTDLLETFKDNVNIQEYFSEPQPQGPPAPSISVSLRGELNPLQASDIAVQAGAKPESGDPLLNPELRKLMGKIQRGQDVFEDENLDSEGRRLDLESKRTQLQSPPQ